MGSGTSGQAPSGPRRSSCTPMVVVRIARISSTLGIVGGEDLDQQDGFGDQGDPARDRLAGDTDVGDADMVFVVDAGGDAGVHQHPAARPVSGQMGADQASDLGFDHRMGAVGRGHGLRDAVDQLPLINCDRHEVGGFERFDHPGVCSTGCVVMSPNCCVS